MTFDRFDLYRLGVHREMKGISSDSILFSIWEVVVMRRLLLIVLLLTLSVPAIAGWEEHKKEVTIGEMGFSLTLPESWSVVPDEDAFNGFSNVDTKILCCPVLIEDPSLSVSIFIYATSRDDFQNTVMDMGRDKAELESDVLELGQEVSKPIYDADGNEYGTLRTLNLVNKKDLAYGIIFHRDGIRYEMYYSPWPALDFGEYFDEFMEVVGTIKFIG